MDSMSNGQPGYDNLQTAMKTTAETEEVENGQNLTYSISGAQLEEIVTPSFPAPTGVAVVNVGQNLMASALDLSQGATATIEATTDVTGQIVADASTLQQLLAVGAVQLTDASGHPLHIVNIGGQSHVMRVLSVESHIPATSDIVSSSDPGAKDMEENNMYTSGWTLSVPTPMSTMTGNLPPGCPSWATKLRDCQKLGDYYRGWVLTDAELELILTEHKQATESTWGTRQSPCPSKETSRLMWKSQYVIFDGIPFLNVGSRAVVQECQYGPRRKGEGCKGEGIKKMPSLAPLTNTFKQTCPARIYIKKVRKFVEYMVNPVLDKKNMKIEMDRVFMEIKTRGMENCAYQERLYVQLPSEEAHMYHTPEMTAAEPQNLSMSSILHTIPKPEPVMTPEVKDASLGLDSSYTAGGTLPGSRIHPLIQMKLRDIVAAGETRLYAIRKFLRKFVDINAAALIAQGETIDKHNLSVFPTVNDLQNHIHQALKDISAGTLPLDSNKDERSADEDSEDGKMWVPVTEPHAQTVTVTLTQHAGQEGHHITKVETHMSDGSTRISDSLTPETAKLLAKLHPSMFTPEMLEQLKAGKTPSLKSISVNTGGGHKPQPVSKPSDRAADMLSAADCSPSLSSNPRKRPAMDKLSMPPAKKPMPTLQSASIASLDVGNDEIDIEGIGENVLLQDSDMSDINVTDPASDSEDVTHSAGQGVLGPSYSIDDHDIVGLSGHEDASLINIGVNKDTDAFQYISYAGQDSQEDHILVDS